ncbi:30S ribosomal protein S15 [Secundilactobacillus oryzae JCM 18671]|uniref:30S ribosomal protein S15 n=1 Tax=Secundilactobacillus oryzae JCM 18671 TaxID=1291743 RepID=A0A081BIM5_9LACO|nr:MazG-like protein [Secundilactobacillus oryzae]GAK47893.1 30S ribosomal protein S15 [Secundilactobacillus oryzae JCM 18671]
MNLEELVNRSEAIRSAYHQLELKQDGHAWTIEQDTLAFQSDAGLVSRLVMADQGSWPTDVKEPTLDYKIAECIWWLSSIATASDVNLEEALEHFMSEREQQLK